MLNKELYIKVLQIAINNMEYDNEPQEEIDTLYTELERVEGETYEHLN